MTINFKEEVLKRKNEIIQDLQNLIKINSEMTTFDPKRKGAPFGEGIKEAFDFMLSLGERDGFSTVNLDGYAGHIEYGNQKDFVGMIGHLDVVPAGSGWTFPPYGAEIHDNKMYGRGTEDDKGPTIAAYYAMKILKELGVPLSKRVKLIIGNDEETAWRCVRHYFSVYPEAPVSGFIPDADFPLIYAEKGISRIFVEGKFDSNDILSFQGGLRDNMVPDAAKANLAKTKPFDQLFASFIKQHNYQGECVDLGDHYVVSVVGKSAHGSTPQFGENAIDRLISFFTFAGIKHPFIEMYQTYLMDDYHGIKLGLNYLDEEMGPLTNNVGVLTIDQGVYRIQLNLRYPNGVQFDQVVATLNKHFQTYHATITVDKHDHLLYKDPNSDLIKTLMNVYIKHTGDKEAKPINIGGGTFARAMPNSVAFGPHFLSKPSFIHQKNEFVDLDDFFLATIIYTEALYELAK